MFRDGVCVGHRVPPHGSVGTIQFALQVSKNYTQKQTMNSRPHGCYLGFLHVEPKLVANTIIGRK
jgi:hypothetical protein